LSEQRTEKPTPQRLRKAREKGQFPAAKEFVSAAQFLVVVMLATSWVAGWWEDAKHGLRGALLLAFRHDWTPDELIDVCRHSVTHAFVPLIPAAAVLFGCTLAFQIGFTNMGVSLGRLAPNFKQFNPMGRLKQIPRQNLPSMIQACLVLGLAGWFVWSIAEQHVANRSVHYCDCCVSGSLAHDWRPGLSRSH
jgi:flagellar biosynthesis protein FlhB